jgi:hypothetical protein
MQKKNNIKLIDIPEVEIKEGEITYNIGNCMADVNPTLYNRLLEEGKIEEANAMFDQKGYHILKDDGTFV